MRIRILCLCLAVLLSGGVSVAAAPVASCEARQVADLPVTRAKGNHLAVPVRIGGVALKLLVDTGSPFSILSQKAIAELGLTPEKYPRPVLRLFYGGGLMRKYVRTDALSFADGEAVPAEFMMAPGGKLHDDIDGVIGLDILLAFDADFDLKDNRLTLYRHHACAGKTGTWTDTAPHAVRVPFDPKDTHIRLIAVIDGAPFSAIVDTGMPNARVSLDAATRHLGLTPQSSGMVAYGGGKRPTWYHYPFRTLTLAGTTIANPGITIDSFSVSRTRSLEAILGLSVLRKFRFYIAGDEPALYISVRENTQ